ncbi:MAG TPA: protein TolR [Devosia sp.]|jgi:biopolymer transport protein TolR|nr:protein TolR [Devosia sp.]
MAMALAQAGGGRRGKRRGTKRPMADINVTPMVDVMLVLLIVFMVAAPLLTVGVPIDLPQTKAKELNTESKPITVSVTPAGDVYLGDKPIDIDGLVDAINAQAPNGAATDQRIYVRGDQSANYGAVMKVMGTLSAGGFSKIGLITAQTQDQAK